MGVRYPTAGAVSAATELIFQVEVPTGAINDVNVTYTLTYAPRATQISNMALFQNGLALTPNVDFTISGPTITYTVAPVTGDKHLAVYCALVP